jgi:hypothetical protein
MERFAGSNSHSQTKHGKNLMCQAYDKPLLWTPRLITPWVKLKLRFG